MQFHTERIHKHSLAPLGEGALLDSSQTLILLFGASDLFDQPAMLTRVLQTYPRALVVGCSTSGEIFGTEITDDNLVAGIIRFSHTELAVACARVTASLDSYTAGKSLAEQLHKPSLRGVFVLSDGLRVNGSELVRGLNDVLKGQAVVTGGLAGDGPRFKRTWVVKDRLPQSGFVTAVGLYGQHIRIGHGSKGGWDKFGPERVVTKADGSVLYELDGKPALQLYKEYLGSRASGLPATGLLFPLALRADHHTSKSLVRTILAVDEAAQSMTFAGDIPNGYLAQLMRANFDRLIQGASEAATSTYTGMHSDGTAPTFAVAVSCVGRRLVLGERCEEETEAALEALPAGSRQIGFYSYGEISPYMSGSCDLHNQTMTLTTFAEV